MRMDATRVRVLVVGAGWRVRRFVVPALLNCGVRLEHVTILRRSSTAADGVLEGARALTDAGDLGSWQPDLTVNCAPAGLLVTLQRDLLGRFPRAVHFCDTPILGHDDDAATVPEGSGGRLHSLEDWPFLPNLMAIARAADGGSGPCDVRIEHFGIRIHFLSFLRTLAARVARGTPSLDERDAVVVGHLGPAMRVSFAATKQLEKAKVFVRTRNLLIEDFFEVESTGHANDEILYRLVDDDGVRYRIGDREVDAQRLPATLLHMFKPWDDRRNVHDLDKVIAVTRVFGGLFEGRRDSAYAYRSSVLDTLTARDLAGTGSAVLRS